MTWGLLVMKIDHDLKTWPRFFAAILSGAKRFEIRSTGDRTYTVGQVIQLHEYDPDEQYEHYTGQTILVRVTYILSNDLSRLMCPGYTVFSFERINKKGEAIG